jgi:hypothetical protein
VQGYTRPIKRLKLVADYVGIGTIKKRSPPIGPRWTAITERQASSSGRSRYLVDIESEHSKK